MTEFDITQRMLERGPPPVGVTRFPKPRVLVVRSVDELGGREARDRGGGPVRRRAAGDAGRGAAGRGDRRGPARARADRQPHRRHRRRALGDGGRVDGRRGAAAARRASAGSTWTPRSRSTSANEYGVAIGEKAAEEIKIAIGSAFPAPTGKAAVVIGRELSTGNTVEVKVDRGRGPRRRCARHRPRDRRRGAAVPRRGAARADARRPGDRHVPHRRREPACAGSTCCWRRNARCRCTSTEHPLETVVIGAGHDAGAPRRLPDVVPAGAAEVTAEERRMTFSIVAADPQTGDWGIAVASKFPCVGAVVPWARAGVGAVATQSWANTAFGPEGLALMGDGIDGAGRRSTDCSRRTRAGTTARSGSSTDRGRRGHVHRAPSAWSGRAA